MKRRTVLLSSTILFQPVGIYVLTLGCRFAEPEYVWQAWQHRAVQKIYIYVQGRCALWTIEIELLYSNTRFTNRNIFTCMTKQTYNSRQLAIDDKKDLFVCFFAEELGLICLRLKGSLRLSLEGR